MKRESPGSASANRRGQLVNRECTASLMGDEVIFWKRFAVRAGNIRKLLRDGKTRLAFNEVEALLQSSGLDVAFELTAKGKDAVVTLTPEGDPEQGIDSGRAVRTPKEKAATNSPGSGSDFDLAMSRQRDSRR
jgi:hypothetical protein